MTLFSQVVVLYRISAARCEFPDKKPCGCLHWGFDSPLSLGLQRLGHTLQLPELLLSGINPNYCE